MSRLLLVLPLVAPLSGCSLMVEIAKAGLEPYTETTAAQGLVLGVAEPTDADMGKLLTSVEDWQPGLSRAAVFVVDSLDGADAPLSGARVALSAAALDEVSLTETAEGRYEADLADYPEGDGLVLSVDDGEARQAVTRAPAGLRDLDLADTWKTGEDLVIDASDQGVDALLVVVIATATGEVVYDSTPQDPAAMAAFAYGDDALRSTVPGDALGEDGLYAVGVAGLGRAGSDSFEGLNPLLSAFLAGEVVFYPVVVSGG